tara:strand:- start:21356 stop:23299 length:1944 start_codon:yes stop_codon:yes gene_type:complete
MIFRPSLLALLAALSLVVPATIVRADAQADARAALQRGLGALGRHDPRTARVELMNAIKADPNLAAARVAQARALLMLGYADAAQAELERAQALGAPPGPMRHLRAHAALLQGRMADALEEARAPDADPKERPFLARMEAQALQALGRYDESARAYDRALALAPDDAALWADIGRFRIATGDIAAALAATDRAVALAPNNVDVLTLRALMVREQYGPDASRAWFEAALKADKDHIPALIEYAATLADLGQASAALGLTRRVLSLAPGHARAYFIQALIAARAGKDSLARSLLTYTKGRLDDQAATRLLRGVLHMRAGNATLAVGELAPLLVAQPLNIRVRLLLARAQYDDAQYADAEATLFPIVERADAGSYALMLAARIHEAMDDRAVAGEFLNRAAALSTGPSQVYRGAGDPAQVAGAADADPTLAAPNLRYIRALLEAGQGQAALARARQLAAANPGAPAAFVALGDCLMDMGRYAQAARAYERAADMRFREDVALRLVDAWQKAGNQEKAQRALGLFLAQNPMNVEGQRLAAAYLLGAGDTDRALALLSNLQSRLGSEDALLMADLARVWIAKGEPHRALPYAAHAYRLLPMSAVTADIFGWTLLKARGANAPAKELLEKAAQLAPGEPLVRQHLAEAGMIYK